MRHIFIVLITLATLSILSFNSTSPPYTGLSELTINLRTSNNADYIAGEVILQNNSSKSKIYNGFVKSNSVTFMLVETGNYSLIMGTQIIVDTIHVSRSDTLLVMVDNAEVISLITMAKQTYLETVIQVKDIEDIGYDPSIATPNDVSFWPFLGVFNGKLVAVFYGDKYHGDYPDVVLLIKIENLTFYWPAGYPILAWDEGILYELSEAYNQRILSLEDIKTIHKSIEGHIL